MVVKSIVTSPIQNAIVESFGGTVMDTLTGFKWMAALIREQKRKNPNIILFSLQKNLLDTCLMLNVGIKME